jgi:RTX calcium-binding nonapeptide repeat (4 copies)
VGRGGNDALFADNVNFAGSATVGTMGGRDLIEAGDEVDTLRAGPANDLLDGGPGAPDDCDGEAGTDTTRGCEILAGVP